MEQYKQVLRKYLPCGTEDIIIEWLQQYRIHLHVSRNRVTKLGDFRPRSGEQVQKITVNYDLNPYEFLITLVHEIAHVEVWKQQQNRVRPHGREWKRVYSRLLSRFLNKSLFPPDLEMALSRHAARPLAASGSDLELARVLKSYDIKTRITLEDIPERAAFRIHNGKRFRKMDKRRKRYRCLCLDNKKIYLVHPMTSVVLEEE
jgi:predicted SprT family Zn-dependent metalloprotease